MKWPLDTELPSYYLQWWWQRLLNTSAYRCCCFSLTSLLEGHGALQYCPGGETEFRVGQNHRRHHPSKTQVAIKHRVSPLGSNIQKKKKTTKTMHYFAGLGEETMACTSTPASWIWANRFFFSPTYKMWIMHDLVGLFERVKIMNRKVTWLPFVPFNPSWNPTSWHYYLYSQNGLSLDNYIIVLYMSYWAKY